MSEPSLQELFNKAVEGLAGQGFERSVMGDGITCAYRGSNGLRCVVGHLLPDEKYTQDLEGMSAGSPYILDAIGVAAEGVSDFAAESVSDFLDNMQNIHDWALDQQTMKRELRSFALDYGLDIPAALADDSTGE